MQRRRPRHRSNVDWLKPQLLRRYDVDLPRAWVRRKDMEELIRIWEASLRQPVYGTVHLTMHDHYAKIDMCDFEISIIHVIESLRMGKSFFDVEEHHFLLWDFDVAKHALLATRRTHRIFYSNE